VQFNVIDVATKDILLSNECAFLKVDN
jgi:hypothetical protein